MARVNKVQLMGTVMNDEFEFRPIGAEKTDGEKTVPVLNFWLRCKNETDGTYQTFPVAAWGEELATDCLKYLKKGSLVFVEGELRYKFVKDPETGVRKKVYTTVKASTVEFVGKKLKDQPLDESINQVMLIGNLVEDPKVSEEGFVIAVDRLRPSRDLKVPNDKLTDYVTLVVKHQEVIQSELKKGSVAIVSGSLMKRKMDAEILDGKPRIVVNVKRIVGR